RRQPEFVTGESELACLEFQFVTVLLQAILLAGETGPLQGHVALFPAEMLAVIGLKLLEPYTELLRSVVHRFPVRRPLHFQRTEPLRQVCDISVTDFDRLSKDDMLGRVDIDRLGIADVAERGGRL